jgi:hypothetical protein
VLAVAARANPLKPRRVVVASVSELIFVEPNNTTWSPPPRGDSARRAPCRHSLAAARDVVVMVGVWLVLFCLSCGCGYVCDVFYLFFFIFGFHDTG